MRSRSFLHPRRVFTTPASVHASEHGEADPEQEELVNPYDASSHGDDYTHNEHSYIESYYYGQDNDHYNMQPTVWSASGTDMRYSDIVYPENDMPYLEPEQDYAKDTWNTTMPSFDEHSQSAMGLLPQSDISHVDSVNPIQPTSVDANDEEKDSLHYGPIPQRQPRRYRTIKRVPLYNGHLVLDCTIPPRLMRLLPVREGREFSHMRYTAITCDPDNFVTDRYSLRQQLYQPPRTTELCIVLTMYNEDERLFTRTMHGVMTNIAYLCSLRNHSTWGENSWKKIVVLIVSDGRHKINNRTLSVLAAMGVYQEGVAKNAVQNKPVQAHLYEYTTQISIDPSLKFRSAERGIVPVQIAFLLKEENKKKINSHRWAFNAFGPLLNPRICILLDVGTMPRAHSIYHLWRSFDSDPKVGGACGEIVVQKGLLWHALLNPLVAAQHFEYKLSNVLDKPMESAFGYISVLPGAFSAYRYEALQNDPMGHGPLHSYFKGEQMHGGKVNVDIFSSNMYLAEDRILCWELVTKRDSAWLLRFVKRAQAETDVPTHVAELISQRRRWLNGSFFAAVHSIIKFGRIYRSRHSVFRKFVLHIEMLYQTFMLFFSWFALANYFLAFHILAQSMEDIVSWIHWPALICEYVYLAFIVYCFLLSMGNRPQGNRIGYLVSMVVFGLIMMIIMSFVVFLAYWSIKTELEDHHDLEIFSDGVFVRIVISVLSTYGIWLLASLMFVSFVRSLSVRSYAHVYECASILAGFAKLYQCHQYLYVVVLTSDAFCNTHDVSWGTKGSTTLHMDLGQATGPSQDAVEVSVPDKIQDVDAAYDDACQTLKAKTTPLPPPRDEDQANKDYYATVRTNVVLAWTLTNVALVILILNLPRKAHNVYMAVLFYSVAALSFFRFLGAICYLYVIVPFLATNRSQLRQIASRTY